MYSIQHYVIKFISDLGQVGGFLWFPPPLCLTPTIAAFQPYSGVYCFEGKLYKGTGFMISTGREKEDINK
jgi:hypothetical protein